MRDVVFALVLALGLGSCGGDGDDEVPQSHEPCDPLAGARSPVTLGEVLALGRAADGTVYLLDETDEGDVRAFVSDSELLRRRRVLGSGGGSLQGVEFYDVDVEGETADDPPFHLYLEIPEGGETTFTLNATPDRGSTDAAADAEALELLGEDALEDFTLENLPPDVAIEYHAKTRDGRRVVVTRPEDDWSYEDFRVFFGYESQVEELEAVKVLRQRDGGSTLISAREPVEEVAPSFDFPVMLVGNMIVPGTATYEEGGEEEELELLEKEPEAIDGLAFFCLR